MHGKGIGNVIINVRQSSLRSRARALKRRGAVGREMYESSRARQYLLASTYEHGL